MSRRCQPRHFHARCSHLFEAQDMVNGVDQGNACTLLQTLQCGQRGKARRLQALVHQTCGVVEVGRRAKRSGHAPRPSAWRQLADRGGDMPTLASDQADGARGREGRAEPVGVGRRRQRRGSRCRHRRRRGEQAVRAWQRPHGRRSRHRALRAERVTRPRDGEQVKPERESTCKRGADAQARRRTTKTRDDVRRCSSARDQDDVADA